eukprot:710234_1
MCCLRTNWRAHSIQSTHLSLIYQTRLEIKIEEQTTADQGNQLCELKQAFEDERRAKEADDLVISKHKRILIKWKMDWRIWTMFLTLNKARKRHQISIGNMTRRADDTAYWTLQMNSSHRII